jgi:hypothetical protein
MAALGVEFVEGEEIISTSPPSNYLVIIGDGLLAAEWRKLRYEKIVLPFCYLVCFVLKMTSGFVDFCMAVLGLLVSGCAKK